MFDVVVVGGGHAGIEAAVSAARMNQKTALFTFNVERIGAMPCNPAIGGPAKGVVVREIEALGGVMGKIADKTALQFRMLNSSKGPGVQSLRVQSDKVEYSRMMKELILSEPGIEVVQKMVKEIVVEDGVCIGIRTGDDEFIASKKVIITAGTYMSSKILVSDTVKNQGPEGDPTTNTLSASLRHHGLKTMRLKTGTPARVYTRSLNFEPTEKQPGDEEPRFYSQFTKKEDVIKDQYDCYLVHTNSVTHEIIHANIDKSSMFSGVVEGVGARYCPSIEDKLVRFSDKNRHQVFLEPESAHLDTTYVQGLSTSLPEDVQDRILRSIPGMEHVEVQKYGYAIEYDALDPVQLFPTMETMVVKNLYTAGQINGTSGYEEAAAQGLMAGINAALSNKGEAPLILGRDEAYIGVMIDDLVTKGTKEPYRLLTSRAEYRLLLRHDNAYSRLSHFGHGLGLLSDETYEIIERDIKDIESFVEYAKTIRVPHTEGVRKFFADRNSPFTNHDISVFDAIKRPGIHLDELLTIMDLELRAELVNQVEIAIKYDGYIQKSIREANKLRSMDAIKLPVDIDYDSIANLSIEGRMNLNRVRPLTMGQASRVAGIHPADLSILAILMKKREL